MLQRTVVLEMRSRCTSTPPTSRAHSGPTPSTHMSDLTVKRFLKSDSFSHESRAWSRAALQWVVSRVPAAAPICRICVSARPLSVSRHVSSFCAGGRGNDIEIPTSQWQCPDPPPHPAFSCSTSMNITPLQRPVVLPCDSHFERTCDARSSRTSHDVATRFTLGPPRTFTVGQAQNV